MSTRPCTTCKKTVYVNEKIEAEGRWYHRPCFKCSAPNCRSSLNLRNFQMAALDDSVLDPITDRPLKVLVCKDHVPMPKHSNDAASLSLSHTASAPKPSIPGLHRALMGERVVGQHDDTNNERKESPRSLDQGSHGLIMKEMGLTLGSSTQSTTEPDKVTSGHSGSTPTSNLAGEPKSMPTSTLPKFRSGRFTISAEEDSLLSAAEAQNPNKDDDSFRNLPVHHHDYDLEDNKRERVFTLKEHPKSLSSKSSTGDHSLLARDRSHERSHSHDVEMSLETEEDMEERMRKEHKDVDLKDRHQIEEQEIKAPAGEDKKLVDLAFHPKMLEREGHRKDESDHKVVEEDEWDAPADSASRRETVAGV
ncbi:hypothetical protein BGZ93_010163 [Podila epicladia]|nr:hypothetical protein BGZ92_000058 [Podila epicladia]KAG0100570.1 hypothetical protein BGZ93_010163 [Podila epicladia]